ncbi:hypothetical protein B0H11DRAFT_2259762 [Mycena galericulata]|nr:hypothetical protein B0H11DRAFT_2259762 [Mycena galericulata]
MSNPTSPAPSVDRRFIMIWGIEFISYTLDIALWGVAVVSVLQYFRKYARKDSLIIRSTVALLAILTTVHSLFLAMLNYKDFVLRFGNFEGLEVTAYEGNVMICAGFFVAFTAQIFYASRIWILSEQDWRYVTPVILLAVLQLSAGIAQTVEVAKVHRNSQLASTMVRVTSTTQGAATLACDITITAILSHILWKSRTGNRFCSGQDDHIRCQSWSNDKLVFFITMPGTFMFSLFILPSFHVYVISVCSMLTSRENLQAELRGSDGIINSYPMSNLQSNSTHNTLADESMVHGVNVSTSVIKWAEDIPTDDNNLDANKISMRHTVV